MVTFDIHVWMSQRLYNEIDNNTPYSPTRPREIAATYLENAFNRYYNDANVTEQTEYPNPPDGDGAQQEQCTTLPCDSLSTKCYSSTWHWWRAQVNASCKSYDKANDVNLLVTKGNGGGLGGSRIAVASVGSIIAPLSTSYKEFGSGDHHNGIDTIQEEAQHCMIDAWTDKSWNSIDDKDNDGTGHDFGDTIYDSSSGITGITPNGVSGDRDYNNCNDYANADTSDGFAHFWSQCAYEHMTTR